MKVYAVMGYVERDGSHLFGVYSTEEKAIAAARAFKANPNSWTVQEWIDVHELEIDQDDGITRDVWSSMTSQ